MRCAVLAVLSLLINFNTLCAGAEDIPVKSWADSVFQTLTLEQKISQLIMVRMYSNKSSDYNDSMLAMTQLNQWGGICFFQSYPVCQALLTNRLQAVSKIPMMIAIDGEWGLAMRLDSVHLYPRQMALGATKDTDMIYEMGKQIAIQCRRIGVNVNFAPDVDINNNPNNPVINSRSFGSDPYWVSKCGTAYMKGMQDYGILTTAKHFPGHGDTKTDSHTEAPLIAHNKRHLQKMELKPFKAMIDAGVDGIMVGHLKIPALDTQYISTSSEKIIKEFLKKEMKFKGLVFTDALEMKGILNIYQPGDLEVQVLKAGADVLLLPSNPLIVVEKIKEAINNDVLKESDIDEKCLKVLKMKEKYVLPNYAPINVDNLLEDINNQESYDIYEALTESSLTLLKNKKNLIPLKTDNADCLHIRLDNGKRKILDDFLLKNYGTSTIRIQSDQLNDTSLISEIIKRADSAKTLIFSISTLSQYPGKNNYGILPGLNNLLNLLSEKKPLILLVMGNPYSLNHLSCLKQLYSILIAYHPTDMAEKAVTKALSYQIPIKGNLPVDLNEYSCGSGISIKIAPILKKIHCDTALSFIDTLVKEGLDAKAYPGCRVLVARDAKIIYDKSFGTYSYEDHRAVTSETIYDLASITKPLATTLAIMKLYEDKKIKLNRPLSDYLLYLKGSNKENITIAQVMTHTAGLKSWAPFYKKTLNPGKNIYHEQYSEEYSIPVCKNLYMKKSYKDTMISYIIESPLKAGNSYLYSDLGFYLLSELVREVSGTTLDSFLYSHIYSPLGLKHTLFNPYNNYPLEEIAPTEYDKHFRKKLIHGYVHDEGAAMFGGVSGHAGLFSNAEDMAILLQMLLNKGNYGGYSYFNSETIDKFTTYYDTSVSRRALGFDKPSLRGESPCGINASSSSYGHSGFTGTFFWIDPKYNLIYIFLSNRVCPDSKNNKLVKMNIRTRIQDGIYKKL